MPRDAVGWAPDAAGHPNPDALAAEGVPFVCQYVGTAYQHYGVSRGYIDDCHARGVGVVLIFEEWSSQFLTGYLGARQSCDRMMAGWDALGAPRDGTVIPHVALVDPTPSAVYGAEGALQDYARGWDDALPFPQWRGYGSKYGLDLAFGVTRKMLGPWGVGTWGYGEAGNGWLPPWTSDAADMIQHGNIGAPIPGTDYNTLFRADMGAWGGPSPSPLPEIEETDDMIYASTDGHAVHMQGSLIAREFDPPADQYGVPDSARQYADEHHITIIAGCSPLLLAKFHIADHLATTAPTGGGAPAPVDYDAIATAVNDDAAARLAKR